MPENWSLLGNAEERDLETAETAADAGLLGPRETLLHFSARLGLEKTTQLLMTKPGAVYCAQIRNQHGELANLIAKANAKLAKDNDREEIDEVTGMKKVKPDFDKIAKIIER